MSTRALHVTECSIFATSNTQLVRAKRYNFFLSLLFLCLATKYLYSHFNAKTLLFNRKIVSLKKIWLRIRNYRLDLEIKIACTRNLNMYPVYTCVCILQNYSEVDYVSGVRPMGIINSTHWIELICILDDYPSIMKYFPSEVVGSPWCVFLALKFEFFPVLFIIRKAWEFCWFAMYAIIRSADRTMIHTG